MTEEDATPEDVIEANDPPEEGAEPDSEEGGEEEIPELDVDEKADVPEGLAAQMAKTRDDPPESGGGEETNDPDEGPSEGGDEGGSEGSEGGSDGPGSQYHWGEVYVDGLAIFLLEISAELNESGETDMTEEDVRDLATSGPIDVSEAAADCFEQSGIGNDMSPGQALVTGSAFMAFAVLMKETDAAGEMIGRVSEGMEQADLGGAA